MLAAIPLGLAIGVTMGMLGGGGSVLAVPVLVYLLDQSVEEATTASLLVVAAASVAGGLGHARAGRICWRHAGTFTAAALPAIILGTLAGNAVDAQALLAAFALVMLAAAQATWRKADDQPEPEGSWDGGAACPPLRLPRDLIAGLAVGFLTGSFGVGGGFLIVPTLAVALAFTMRTAVGTSLAIITATSLLGLLVHLLAGRTFDTEVTSVMAIASVAGALAGAVLATHITQKILGRAFAGLVTGVALYLLLSVAVLGGPPSS
ncbi:MAG: sulfite exporter TauE/SafE family protein [Thermoleophilaceae bacterium]|nr:sulfite exporter TauE/SafE family protein [Thermoleophilaceae bacterium]